MACRHARVYEEDGGFYVEDLKSTHGTHVAAQRLTPAEPMRLFDGLRVALGNSGFEAVPCNTMAAVMAAMRNAQQAQVNVERERQEKEDEDDDDDQPVPSCAGASDRAMTAEERSALLAGPNRVVGSDAPVEIDEDEEMRAFLPMTFGKVTQVCSSRCRWCTAVCLAWPPPTTPPHPFRV